MSEAHHHIKKTLPKACLELIRGGVPFIKGVTPSRRAGIHLPKERTKKGKRERGERGEAKKGGPETQEAECAQSGRGQGCNSRSKGQEHTKRESTFSSPIPKAPCLGCCHRRIISGLVVYMVVHASRLSRREILHIYIYAFSPSKQIYIYIY